MTPADTPAPHKPARAGRGRGARWRAVGVQLACLAVTAFMFAPVYLVALAALSTPESLNRFPLSLLPTDVSVETMASFLTMGGVLPAFVNSLIVGVGTLVLSVLIGLPAGYALARYVFAGRDAYQLFMLLTRALPIVVLSVPLAQLFLTTGLYDTTYAVILLHTALALPTTVLITSAVFVGVPRDQEEAAQIFGATPVQAFVRVVLPQALPGIAAAGLFTFVTSWNEVLGAAILTLDRRTLPAQVLSTLGASPLTYRFAGGFALIVPALVFVALMRKYLLSMWGTTLR
ncbi:carbohydrate ABC transporter permease [Goodfellowiella coeruleoviolacea]|uniref:Multiple sugar transport system permease protein n=1 Tax=Goodfellowiella coeruleoviolacea TaxID=334858 RepID=A0AAE3GI30_9PSEU|nr:carbohydrate ABC transporter permease [Goodfellowiella coeruleoviolacea]MCP2168565.1 multiple sugar transport system permease protein [Goodfellowiella coeruleoviolacea]